MGGDGQDQSCLWGRVDGGEAWGAIGGRWGEWEFLYICLMLCEPKTVLKIIDLKMQVNKYYERAIFSHF